MLIRLLVSAAKQTQVRMSLLFDSGHFKTLTAKTNAIFKANFNLTSITVGGFLDTKAGNTELFTSQKQLISVMYSFQP